MVHRQLRRGAEHSGMRVRSVSVKAVGLRDAVIHQSVYFV